MLAGHIGAALAIGRAERRLNLGALVFAALLLDSVLWLFVLLGWESVSIPADYASTHRLVFVFPYSHGLLAAVAWSALAGIAAFLWYSRLGSAKWRITVFVVAAVFSHWLLDWLVHVPDLPLAGEGSPKAGLGLWQNIPLALTVEAFITLAGLGLFLQGSRLSRARMLGIALLTLVILVFTIAGMTLAPPPPSPTAVAATSLGTILLLSSLIAWLEKRRVE